MKNSISIFIAFLLLFLSACSGSETYRGNWKAMDLKGNKFEINFDAKSLSISDSSGKEKKLEYTQQSVHINNSEGTYGIRLADRGLYEIYFQDVKDASLGLIRDGNGTPMYTISRTDYVRYEDMYKLN